ELLIELDRVLVLLLEEKDPSERVLGVVELRIRLHRRARVLLGLIDVAIGTGEILSLVTEKDVELASEFVRLCVLVVELHGFEHVIERLAVIALVVRVDREIVLRVALTLGAVDAARGLAAARERERRRA